MSLTRLILRIALCLALVLGIAGSASASPDDVLRDYHADGVINGSYSVGDLTGALALARQQGDAQYADAAGAIDEARNEALAGASAHSAVPSKSAPAAVESAGGISSQELERPAASAWPTPPLAQPGSDVPLPFVVLSAMAVVLVAAGAVSAGYRRLTRSS